MSWEEYLTLLKGGRTSLPDPDWTCGSEKVLDSCHRNDAPMLSGLLTSARSLELEVHLMRTTGSAS